MYSPSPKSKRVEFRCPDPSCNPYLAFSALLMAALDGIQNKIDPGDPLDKDLYDLAPEEAAEVRQTPGSLDEVLASQARMLEHSGREPSADDKTLLRRAFEAQLEAARATLERRATPILFVSYAEAVAEPDRIATEVCAFVGGDLDIEAAASVVSPSLYRNRSLC